MINLAENNIIGELKNIIEIKWSSVNVMHTKYN